MNDVDHVFLTRFNLPSEGVESLIRARDGWLRERVGLFERYTLPSLAAQTCRNFRWIVYVDPQSPSWLLERLRPHIGAGAFTAVFRETVSHGQLLSDINDLIGVRRDQLLTTNLDNDDGLANDFVARLQAEAVERPTALYVRDGLIMSPRGLYLRRDPVNAFCSVREPWRDDVSTCWADWHNLLGQHMPTRELSGEPGWLQVVHGNNVSNRVRGRLVAPTAYRGTFGSLIEDVSTPSPAVRCREALVARPGRAARESVRALAKRAVVSVGGKAALGEVRYRLRQATAHRG